MSGSSLPPQPTPFIGREDELVEIAGLVAKPDCRLLTLLGPGGIGKTRLALEAARLQQNNFAGRVYFVPLQPLTSPEFIVPAIGEALLLPLSGEPNARNQLLDTLREKALLLVLDNFEHLIDGVQLLAEILIAAPQVKLLVTSRERLNLLEEWVVEITGLSYPSGDRTQPIEDYDAVQLFVQRARQIQKHFSLSENRQTVQTICQQVEGMPLGLELAASWLRVLTSQQLAAHMSGSAALMTTPLRNVPERHHSIKAVFEQSWKLLSSDEQRVLTRLSVFRGGFDREAAEQVAGASLPLLAVLVDKSLVRLNPAGRYDLHELLRQYAADKLAEAGEADAAIQTHLNYFLKLAEGAEAHTFGREQVAWFDRLETELDNLRAALAWSLRDSRADTGLRLAAAMRWFFSERYYMTEGAAWLERLLAANPDVPPSLRAKALHSAAALGDYFGDGQQTPQLYEQALTLARAENDRWNIAWTLSASAIPPNASKVAALLDESLALFRELDDAMGIAHTLIRRGWYALDQADYTDLEKLLDEAFQRAQEAGDRIIIGWVAYTKGRLSWQRDHDLPQAASHFENALFHFNDARMQIGCNVTLMVWASIEQEAGNMTGAQLRLQENLFSLQKNIPNKIFLPFIFVRMASIARASGQYERAALLLGAANSSAQRIERDVGDLVTGELIARTYPRVDFAGDLSELRTEVGGKRFAEAWAAGNAMTQEQAIAYALEGISPSFELPPHEGTHDSESGEILTAREVEILRLMADGLNSREIAKRLVLSVGTVRWYVKQIYSKLDAHSRSEALAHARKRKFLLIR